MAPSARQGKPNPALLRLWSELGIPADYAQARTLRVQREPSKLVHAGRSPAGRSIQLTPRTAAAWEKMRRAADLDHVTLLPISGFRSVARQADLIRTKRESGEPIARILRVLAAPGCSEHHSGRALDIGCPGYTGLTPSFGRTRAFRWLKQHARRFGFSLSYPRHNRHRICYEPWHWCWRPA